MHQSDLLAKLTASLHDFREAQKVAYADLPHPDPWDEVAPWNGCKSLRDVAAAVEQHTNTPLPRVTLLRCTLADLAAQNKPATADNIFSSIPPSLLNTIEADQVNGPHQSFLN